MISTLFIVAFLTLFLACNIIGAEIDGAEDVPGVRGRHLKEKSSKAPKATKAPDVAKEPKATKAPKIRQLKQKSSKAPKLPDEAPKGTKAPKVPKAL